MSSQWHDPAIADWLAEGPNQGPAQGLERALAAVRRVEQRPGWTFPGWWLPWTDSGRAFGRLALVGLLLVLVALLLAAVAATLPGSNTPIRGLLGESGDMLVAYQSRGGVHVEQVDGTQRRQISAPGQVARSPLFSPDGQRIAYLASSVDEARWTLVVARVDGSAPAVEVSGSLEVIASDIASFDWAPDGSQIAFAAREQGSSLIFVVGADGSGLRAVTDGEGNADLPSWSPDGQRVAYRAIDPNGQRWRLRTVRPDGTEDQDVVLVVAADGFLSKLRWSPVAEGLAYYQNVGFGTQTTAVIDLLFGHTVQPWTDGVGGHADNGMPWSPDGQQLAILTAGDGVIVADVDEEAPEYNGELRRLGHVADCWIDWSPDGTALYGGSPDGCRSVVVIPLSDPESAATLPDSGPGTASWQPLP